MNPSIEILFIPDDIEGQFVFDPKTAIVKPSIGNYINETLKQLKTERELFHPDLQKAWEQYNPARACKIISLLSVNNLNHSEAFRTKMCLSCSPLLNPTSDLLPSSSQQSPIRRNSISDILQMSSDLQLNILPSNLIDLIDCNLDSVVLGKLDGDSDDPLDEDVDFTFEDFDILTPFTQF